MLNQRLDGTIVREADKEVEYLRKHDEIAKGNSAEKQKHGRNNESRRSAALVLVKAGRNKLPDLKQHPRHRHCMTRR